MSGGDGIFQIRTATRAVTKPCPTTKVPYPTRAVAARELWRHWSSGARRVYRCPWCDQYHLTSKPRDDARYSEDAP